MVVCKNIVLLYIAMTKFLSKSAVVLLENYPLLVILIGVVYLLGMALATLFTAVTLVSQIIPPIGDSFALPFEFFLSMLGISVDVHQFEFGETNGDEKDKASIKALCDKFWSIKAVWNRRNAPKIILRIL